MLWSLPPALHLSSRRPQREVYLSRVQIRYTFSCQTIIHVEVRTSNDSLLIPAGVHTCFVCKKRGEDVRRCMIPVCGKFYHGECITNHAPTAPVNRGFRCSIHVCLTCFIANPNSSSISKGSWSGNGSVPFSGVRLQL